MNNKKLLKYLRKNYYPAGQKLKLKGWVDAEAQLKEKVYFHQEVYYKDYYICDIQTWDCVPFDEIAHTPYCMKCEWGGWCINVPKFGQLTDEDIAKAIGYTIRRLSELDDDFFGFWNIYFEDKHIQTLYRNDWEWETETLRQMTIMKGKKNADK